MQVKLKQYHCIHTLDFSQFILLNNWVYKNHIEHITRKSILFFKYIMDYLPSFILRLNTYNFIFSQINDNGVIVIIF